MVSAWACNWALATSNSSYFSDSSTLAASSFWSRMLRWLMTLLAWSSLLSSEVEFRFVWLTTVWSWRTCSWREADLSFSRDGGRGVMIFLMFEERS